MALNINTKKNLLEDIKRREHADAIEAYRDHIEEKNRYRNLNKYLNMQRQEYEEDKTTQKAKEDVAFREKQILQENELARELDKIKREEIKELRLRQQIRENSPELRELERKLKAAYVNKELAAQIAQKEAEKLNERIMAKRTYETLRKAWIQEEEFNKKVIQDDIMKKAYYKQELQDQMIMKEKSKRYLYEEFLREKKMIDDIIERIHDEDEREIAEKMCNMKRTRAEMVAFKSAQDLWKKRKREEIEEENKKIQEYLTSKAIELKARQADKGKLEAQKSQISEKIAKQIYEEQAKKREREDIIQDLLEEEQKDALERRHRQEMEDQLRKRISTRDSLEKQMLDKIKRQKEEAANEARFRDELLAQLAEDQKLEQMSAQKKRMKMLQLRRDVEQMMIERRQKHAEEMQLLIKLEEQEHAEIEQRKRLVEEERIRMLKDHVKNLIGYLPKGLLKTDDLPSLGSEIIEQVSPNLRSRNLF